MVSAAPRMNVSYDEAAALLTRLAHEAAELEALMDQHAKTN
jgi:hypothetical protein